MTRNNTRVATSLSALLLLLTVFGPISMDLYLPALPALTRDLGASTSAAQLTVTACLIGLGVGQVIAGPISDRFGRRRPLVVGIVLYVVTSAACAVSPSIATLVVARVAQGLAGAVGIVIAQAAGRDLYEGGALIRFFGRLTVLGGLAAIVGPLIGGQLTRFTDWRGMFVFLAVIGVLLLVATVFLFGETLPLEQRTSGGLSRALADFGELCRIPSFLGAVLAIGFLNAALFAYLSGATFVLQDIYGLTPQQYSYAFGLNSLGFVIGGYVGGRTSEAWSERGTLVIGIAMTLAGSLGLLATGIATLPVGVVIVSLLTLATGVAVATPPTTSIAMADHPDKAGTASALLGFTKFGFGGVAAPLVGLGGASTVLPLGLVTVVASLIAGACYWSLIRPEDAPVDIPVEVPRQTVR